MKNKIKFENRNNKRRILIHIKQEGQYSSQVIDTYIHGTIVLGIKVSTKQQISIIHFAWAEFSKSSLFLCNFSWNLMGGKGGEVVGQ